MPIVVSCQCGARFAARDDLVGQTLACPKCSAPLRIGAAPAPVDDDGSGVASILNEIGVKADERGTLCPKCGHVLRMGSAICSNCFYNLQTASYLKRPEALAPNLGEKIDWKKIREGDKTNLSTGVVDEELTGTDVFLCLVCCPISWLYGLLLFCRGNSKGLKLILMSYLLPMISSFIHILLQVLFMIPRNK